MEAAKTIGIATAIVIWLIATLMYWPLIILGIPIAGWVNYWRTR